MHLLICLLTHFKVSVTLSHFLLFTLNLEWLVITNIFSLYEYESSWNKPLHELYCRAGTFLVSRKYIPFLLKYKKPQPI